MEPTSPPARRRARRTACGCRRSGSAPRCSRGASSWYTSAVARQQAEHLALDLAARRRAHRRGRLQLDPACRRIRALERLDHRALGHARELGQQMGVLALADGVGSGPRGPGAPRRPPPLPLDGREVVARPLRRIMYSTSGSGAGAASRRASAAVLPDEVRRVEALGQDQDDRPGPGTSRGTRRRARRRARRPRRSRTPAPRVGRTARAAGSASRRAPCRTWRPRSRRRPACQRDHVGVALDQEDLAAARDGALRPVEVVEDLALAVDGRLGGVEVLRRSPARGSSAGCARRSRRRAPTGRGWGTSSAPEAVADRPPSSPDGEPGLDEDLGGQDLSTAAAGGSPDTPGA